MAQFYLVVSEANRSAEALEMEMLSFREELSQHPGIKSIETVTEASIPEGAKGIGKAIAGFFELEIVSKMVGSVIETTQDMAMGRDVEIIKKAADGSSLELRANVKDLAAVQEFLKGLDAE